VPGPEPVDHDLTTFEDEVAIYRDVIRDTDVDDDLPPLTHRLAEMTPGWAKAVAPVAEATTQAFLRTQSESSAQIGSLPTLLTEANRSAGREPTKWKEPKSGVSRRLGLPPACKDCGVVMDDPSRKYCEACFPDRREAIVANFANAGPAVLAKRRADGTDPAHTVEARRKQGLRAVENVRANAEWEQSNGNAHQDLNFTRDILPRIQAIPLSSSWRRPGSRYATAH